MNDILLLYVLRHAYNSQVLCEEGAPGEEHIWACIRDKPPSMHRLSDRVLGALRRDAMVTVSLLVAVGFLSPSFFSSAALWARFLVTAALL